MRKHSVLLVALFTIAVTALLSGIWEFMIDGGGLGFMIPHHMHEHRGGFVLTATASAALSITVFSILTLRTIAHLKAAQEKLRESELRSRSFAADAAHELRTPLAILRANLDNLEDTKTARTLREDVDSMGRMVEQLLASTRLDGLQVSADEVCDLAKVGQNVAVYLAPIAIREDRSIEVVGGEGPPILVNANPDALALALRNLVENAIKYSARGTTITIHVTSEPAVSVINRGRNVPADKRETIFKRFLRADRRADGAGLGLSIVQKVIEAHQGRVDVSDTPGGGATFTVHLRPIQS